MRQSDRAAVNHAMAKRSRSLLTFSALGRKIHDSSSGRHGLSCLTCATCKRDSVFNIAPTAARMMLTLAAILSVRLNNQLAEEIPFSEALERFRRLGKR